MISSVHPVLVYAVFESVPPAYTCTCTYAGTKLWVTSCTYYAILLCLTVSVPGSSLVSLVSLVHQSSVASIKSTNLRMYVLRIIYIHMMYMYQLGHNNLCTLSVWFTKHLCDTLQ